jgi:hydrogenase maturation factor
MCLTIPKKVISIEGNNITIENPSGDRQNVKSVVELSVGDFCLTQQNVAIYKLEKKEAQEVLGFFEGKEGNRWSAAD